MSVVRLRAVTPSLRVEGQQFYRSVLRLMGNMEQAEK